MPAGPIAGPSPQQDKGPWDDRLAACFDLGMRHDHVHPTTNRTRLLTVLFAGALLVGACGDDSNSTSGTTDTSGGESAGLVDPSDGADGSDSSPELTTDDLSDACNLLDDADLETLVGPESTAEADSGSMLGLEASHPYAECRWERSDEADGLSAVGVTIVAGDVFTNFEQEVYEAEPVEGLGERAVTIQSYADATGGGTGTSMIVDQGSVTVIVGAQGSVSFDLGDEEVTHDDDPDLRALTEKVLDRLDV
jgi:hypothetical protein